MSDVQRFSAGIRLAPLGTQAYAEMCEDIEGAYVHLAELQAAESRCEGLERILAKAEYELGAAIKEEEWGDDFDRRVAAIHEELKGARTALQEARQEGAA